MGLFDLVFKIAALVLIIVGLICIGIGTKVCIIDIWMGTTAVRPLVNACFDRFKAFDDWTKALSGQYFVFIISILVTLALTASIELVVMKKRRKMTFVCISGFGALTMIVSSSLNFWYGISFFWGSKFTTRSGEIGYMGITFSVQSYIAAAVFYLLATGVLIADVVITLKTPSAD